MSRAKYLRTNPRKEPREISDVLGQVIESIAAGADVRQSEMVDRWTEFVPQDWAAGNPIGVRDGVLLVEVTDGTQASVLRYQIAPLLRAITDEFGADLVASVRVRIARR